MTTISNVNIVVQQSGGAKEAQHLRHAVQDYTHVAAEHQRVKDVQALTTVQQSENSREAKLEKETPDRRRRRKRREPGRKDGAAADTAGKLVDTIA